MLTVLGGLAEFERELIRARTGEGRARAKANGQSLGRPFKLTLHQRSEAIRRRDRGEPLSEIARSYNVPRDHDSQCKVLRLSALSSNDNSFRISAIRLLNSAALNGFRSTGISDMPLLRSASAYPVMSNVLRPG
jgi:hypothetical protein